MMRWMVVVVVLTGCVASSSQTCPNGLVCPIGTTCHVVDDRDVCASQEDLAACATRGEGASCDSADSRKTCHDGICINLCGNHRLDGTETCDDGNRVGGDDCSANCVIEGCGGGEIDLFLGEECDDGVAGVSGDGCSSTCRLEKPVWTEIVQHGVPRIADHAMARSPGPTGHVVMFGGINIDGISGETWIWRYVLGQPAFEQRFPVRSPSARHGHSMAYDVTHNRTVLFGGYSAAGFLSDVWEWDGTTWTNVTPVSSPEPRMNAGFAYDPLRDVFVMTGGVTPTGPISTTWEWSSATKTWTNRDDTPPPLPNNYVQLAYDGVRNEMIYCGANGNPSTFKYDGTWTNLFVPCPTGGVTLTGPRRMAFDSHRGKIILLQASGLVWEWDPITPQWIAKEMMTQFSAGTALFDDGSTLAMFGGHSSGNWSNDSFNKGAWTRGTSSSSVFTTQSYFDQPPVSRLAGAAAYDTKRQRAIVVGGTSGTASCLNDSWFFDDQQWHSDQIQATFAARCEHAIAYDESRDVTVMFGGTSVAPKAGPPFTMLGDTWERTGDAAWQQRTLSPQPSPRRGAAMAYDGARKQIILFGGDADTTATTGQRLADTWSYDATGWRALSPATSPPGRSDAMMAYDPERERIVLFGGSDGLAGYVQDTWEWDGTTWTKVSDPSLTANVPPSRAQGTMVYDPLRHRIVLLGGGAPNQNGARYSDVWEWDGTSWERVHDDPAQSRLGAHGFFAPLLGGVVRYGGEVSLDSGYSSLTHVLRWTSSGDREVCRIADDSDRDGDGFHGCEDPDCEPRCSACGNNVCDPFEDRFICGHDCQ